MTADKTSDWRALLFCVALPAALALVVVAAVALLPGCKQPAARPAEQADVGHLTVKFNCAYDDRTLRRAVTCVAGGVVYKCAFDDRGWKCAALGIPPRHADGGAP